MKDNIRTILEELYESDPSLRDDEARLIPVLEKLMKGRETVNMDSRFKEELRQKLLERDQRKIYKRRFKPAVFALSGAAAALLAVFITLPFLINRYGGASEEAAEAVMPMVMSKSADMSLSETADEAPLFSMAMEGEAPPAPEPGRMARAGNFNTEEYSRIYENSFLSVMDNPLSTFSIDVDTASYANVRRFLNSGTLPPPDAVRIEELINYFPYHMSGPTDNHPFSIHTQVSRTPWNADSLLLKIGIQGKRISFDRLPPNNLVFLLDVSGSMNNPDKLPLLKNAMNMIVANMRPEDSIAIAVYAGAAGTVLPPTGGDRKEAILEALDNLEAGGSTAGAQGIRLAYSLAGKNFEKNGNNRIILATDGDFNVGPSSEGELVRMIEKERESGIYLTVLGFGSGNIKDSKMEMLADRGNGNYAYIDTLLEARKVLVEQMGGTFFTIAEDVKLQLEFNPVLVDSYRLIGYENRMLAREDFDDDRKDAGELGAGHSVTALYELMPASGAATGSDLKYQSSVPNSEAYAADELLTVKMRYKEPGEGESILLERPVENRVMDFNSTDDDFRFASAVAMWGLILRDSEYKGMSSYEKVLDIAGKSRGDDPEGYRNEFLRLVKLSREYGEW
ncbi:vWA domain-containing protein [Spirochaeta isovalerica]|uniref:Ca-activated chloride channel family protein n=1 Tax=Spirochaeta isovalerica TaxID=150 RepID=A0A841R8W6_9SPIO|nr:VWA domain-containing protein [Spirochaeta isovalerica]MBB6481734.1 Ca-activated chloride channel family protein [Spirochaeta isovalerica]